MVKAGDVIEHPVFGERIVFHYTGRETNGELLQFEDFVKPHISGPPEHIHANETEKFTVLAGELKTIINGEHGHYVAGEDFVVPAGTPHRWWNEGDVEARLLIEFRPAGRMDAFLATLFALAQNGRTNAKGLPNPLQLAVILQEFIDDNRLAKPSRGVQKAILGILSPIGHLLGYKAEYPYPKEN
jgi:quercetin dioxygenase-like cupin family protein